MAATSPHARRGFGASPQVAPLIEEAWERRRRRHRRWLAGGTLAAAIAAALGTLLSQGRAAAPPPPPSVSAPPAQATPAQVSAFVAGAQRALNRRFTATYSVTLPKLHGRSVHSTVVAVHRRTGPYVFRETPSFGTVGRAASSETFFAAGEGSRRGGYTCTRTAGQWSCMGPYRGIGMGTTWQVWGPYPPQNLFGGLQNAVATYSDAVMTHTHRAPMYIVNRRLDRQSVRCLEFGRLHSPVGTVCLNRLGMIALYDVPEKLATSSDYRIARLESYSTKVSRSAFKLPAAPNPYPA